MNVLTICGEVSKLAGLGPGPTDIVGQTSDYGRIVTWVTEAWDEIQNEDQTWKFMYVEKSFNTSADKQEHTLTELSLDDMVDRWLTETFKIYKVSDGKSTERKMNPHSWEDFEFLFNIGDPPSAPPYDFTIRYPGDIVFSAPADDVYTITGTYKREPTTWTDKTTVPDMPSKYHWLIVYKALEKYAIWDNAPEKLALAMKQIDKLEGKMRRDQKEVPRLRAQPLAGHRVHNPNAWMINE